MSTIARRGGFVEGLENIDLTAPVSEGGCCGTSGASEGCCGEHAVAAEGATATADCCGEPAPTTGTKSSGCCGGTSSDGCC